MTVMQLGFLAATILSLLGTAFLLLPDSHRANLN